MIEASSGLVVTRRGTGISFWVCIHNPSVTGRILDRFWSLTIVTTAFPESLVVRGNGASRPESLSLRTTNSWCGRFPLPLSLAVRTTLSASELPRAIGFESGVFALILLRQCQSCSLVMHARCQVDVLLLDAIRALLGRDRDKTLVETP